jgi:5-methylcytosine-specific restriction endonuclease McrA
VVLQALRAAADDLHHPSNEPDGGVPAETPGDTAGRRAGHHHRRNAGRRHRAPPPALRRAVRERDRARCQFPVCNSRRTDIHHIHPWAQGGATRLSNLILLCELFRDQHNSHYARLAVA